MNITPEEAQAALNDIRQMTTKTQGLINFWAYYMLLWGAVWTLGFLASQFFPHWTNWIWLVMIVIGMAGSGILGIIQAGRMRPTPGSQEALIGARIGISYGVLYGFTVLWMIIFHLNSLQIGMLWITVAMFGSIVSGIWSRTPVSIVAGVGITLISVLGYYLLPHYFSLWAAVFAGLPLVALGFYYLRKR